MLSRLFIVNKKIQLGLVSPDLLRVESPNSSIKLFSVDPSACTHFWGFAVFAVML